MKIFTLFFILTISLPGISQNFKQKYDELLKKEDKVQLFQHIQSWEKQAPNDPEMYVAYCNFYFQESRKEVIALDTNPGKGENLQLTNPKSQQSAGFLHSEIVYDDSVFNLSQHYLNEGIAKHPKRLDMYFGKIYTLGQKGDYKEQTLQIIKVIQKDAAINHDWLWADNEKVEEPIEFFKGGIQDYVYELFHQDEPEAVAEISQEMLKFFPTDVRNLSNVGVYHLSKDEFDEALPYFLKAHKLAPKDVVLLSNLGYTYEQKKEYKEAIKYFEKLKTVGNKDEQAYAKSKIELLKRP